MRIPMSEQATTAPAGTSATLPLIVLEEAVVFPYTVVTLPLDETIAPAVEASRANGRLALLAARREDADPEAPLALQLHQVGTVARIEQVGTLPNGSSGIVVRGLVRATLIEQTRDEPPFFSFVERPDRIERSPELDELLTEVHAAIDSVLQARPGVPQEIRNFVRSITDPGQLADNTGYSSDYTFDERQDLLETFDIT